MDSVLNLLFEEWNNGNPIPNGSKFGCRFPYCSEYIQTNNIKLIQLDHISNVYFPIDLNTDFYSIFKEGFFSNKILSLIHTKKIKVLLLREHEGGGNHIEFFHKLFEFIKTHNLNANSFYLSFANKKLDEYYIKSIGDVGLNIHISDWLLEHTSLILNDALKTNKLNELGYRFELPSFLDSERKFNFLCLNRVPKAHRVSFIAKLIKDDIIQNIDWSMLFSPNEFLPFYGEEKIDNHNIFSIEHFSTYFDRNELEELESELKYVFYTKKKSIFEPESKSIYQYFGDTKSTHFRESYDNSYCSLITETSFENNEEHLTEKSFKPFINLHLAIFLAPYKHLERLREYGFKTFSDFWDESYDEIESPKERMKAVTTLIKNINEKDVRTIYREARSILEYNQTHSLNFYNRESCKKYFKKLANGI
jgi:hypothetical protein